MKKRLSLILILCSIAVCVITGCSGSLAADDPDTTLTIKKDGSAVSVIKESFDMPDYDINELKSDIEAAVSDYNKKEADAVKLLKAEAESGVTDVELSFLSLKDYEDFNGEILRTEDAELAAASDLSDLVSTDDMETKLDTAGIDRLSGAVLLTTDVKDRIYLPGKALYISKNAYASEDKRSVRLNEDADGLLYVIYK